MKTMQNTTSKHVPSAIQGFNREVASLRSIRKTNPVTGEQEIAGWAIEFTCGTTKKFLNRFFHDAYGAACSAIESHHHG